jgi:NitT/TauT family transport system permease protein
MNHAIAVFSPNAVLNKNAVRALVAVQVVIVLLLWVFSPLCCCPNRARFERLWRLVGAGLGAELITSFYLNIQAIAVSTVVSLLLAYATVMPFFRPLSPCSASCVSVAGRIDLLLHADGQERP